MIQKLRDEVDEVTMRRFTVEQYHRMIDAGVFVSGPPAELLDGLVVAKMSQNPPHRALASRLFRWISSLLPETDWTLIVEGPITLAESEPEPDLAVARGPDTQYLDRHPGPEEIVLLVEVSDSTLAFDRRVKLPIYATAGLQVVWIINVVEKIVEIYTNPRIGDDVGYESREILGVNDTLNLVIDGQVIGSTSVQRFVV